jgi:hypothetical protein
MAGLDISYFTMKNTTYTSDEALYRTLDYTISYLASGNRILFAEVPAV